MPMFCLSHGPNRSVISSIPLDEFAGYEGFYQAGVIEAPDWLSAKASLGYELTPLQQQMLPLDLLGRMNAQLADANYGRNPTPWSKST
jgi:hypothetical protein